MSSGSLVVLIDVRKSDSNNSHILPMNGLWKLFKSLGTSHANSESYTQAFLKGHTSSVSFIEVDIAHL